MLGDPEQIYALTWQTLLDVLQLLGHQRSAVILVGAQAIYLHTGDAGLAIAPSTKDADLALDPSKLAAEPKIERLLRDAGFQTPTDQIGIWRRADTGGQIDFLVPEALSGGGRRAARLETQGKRLAHRALGLEGALVDNSVMEIRAIETSDDRSFRIAVAGPGALLVAKLHKLGERQEKQTRLSDKDALDIYRLLQAVPTRLIADGVTAQLDASISRDVAHQGIRYLDQLFGAATSEGSVMAARALAFVDDPDVVALSVSTLAMDLIAALGDRDP